MTKSKEDSGGLKMRDWAAFHEDDTVHSGNVKLDIIDALENGNLSEQGPKGSFEEPSEIDESNRC